MKAIKTKFWILSLSGVFSGVFLVGVFPAEATYLPPGVCLSPLEQAVLVHGKTQSESLADQLTKKESDLEDIEEEQDRIREDIREMMEGTDRTKGLENSLNPRDPHSGWTNVKKAAGSNLAQFVEAYIEGGASELSALRETSAEKALFSGETTDSPERGDGKDLPACENDDPNKCYYLPWASDASAFQSQGRINEIMFCNDYAYEQYIRDCRRAIERIERLYDKLDDLDREAVETQDDIYALEDEIDDREDSGENETEGDGLCWECLDQLREMDGLTTGQALGNILSVVAGAGLSWFGYQSGKRAARATDRLRAKQGFDPLGTSGPAWAGASLGLPFISNGIYGLTNANSNLGLGCDEGYASGHRSYSPFSHYNHGAGGHHHHYGPNPYGSMHGGGEFGMRFGGHHGGSPWGDLFGGMHGGGEFGMRFGAHGGSPWGDPFGGMHGGGEFGMRFGAHGGSPWGDPFGGMHGGGEFGMRFGAHGGSPWGDPFGGMHGGGEFGMRFGGQHGPYGSYGDPYSAGASAHLSARYAREQAYMEFRQKQMQAEIEAKQAWLQHQQTLQEREMQKTKVINGLMSEMNQIRQQIYMVKMGGGVNSSVMGATGSFSSSSGSLTGSQSSGIDHQPVGDSTGGATQSISL